MVERIKKYVYRYSAFLPYLFGFKKIANIPVIINNRNRLSYLIEQIEWLEKAGITNIYIIDNASTYPPLLEFYEKTKYKIIKLTENVGYLALWQTGIYKQFEKDFYIYTDPDVVPTKECPLDAIHYFFKLFKKNVDVDKIGFGLKIDDLPDHYHLKEKVISHERQFWSKEREIMPQVFHASIDTTFALYRPGVRGGYWLNCFRTGMPYVARHLPWYNNSSNINEEEDFYIKNIYEGASHWTGR